MGNDQDDLDRKLQAEKLRDIMKDRLEFLIHRILERLQ